MDSKVGIQWTELQKTHWDSFEANMMYHTAQVHSHVVSASNNSLKNEVEQEVSH